MLRSICTQRMIQQLYNTFTHSALCTRYTVKGLKDTRVHRKLPSLHGGSLEILLTVPLSCMGHELFVPKTALPFIPILYYVIKLHTKLSC